MLGSARAVPATTLINFWLGAMRSHTRYSVQLGFGPGSRFRAVSAALVETVAGGAARSGPVVTESATPCSCPLD